ncbi:Hypothetical_protein [Hexamita inflata]|uniref:Hypothetical_protein n=1 Tax=Hexamita inflata TaxID=28002 RepID=A0AA86RKS9_9EUKA|nr:Hypothetical protein HINF_LOCUS64318 [Hexamita inflata]
MWYIQLVQTEILKCLDIPSNSQLRSQQQKFRIQLVININQNCQQYIGQNMTVSLNFINIVLPQSMGQHTQQFNAVGQQIITFQLDEATYDKVKLLQQVDYTIQFQTADIINGVVKSIIHTTLDSRSCWDDIKFSVDRDWAFNISVVPFGCQISKSIKVSLEYFNVTWINIPIIPTSPTGPFDGYKTGDFDYQSVFFFNTSSDQDLANADLIINFVEYFKLNLNVLLQFRIEEIDISSSIPLVYQQEINQYSNALSLVAQPLPTRCTLDTWYCYTAIQDPTLIVSTFSSIPGGVSIFSQQYTYDEDKQFENQASFRLPIASFAIRKGITYQYQETIAINETKAYYYLTFIQLQDAQGKMLAGIYYSGMAHKSCFEHMQYQWFNDKVCIQAFFKDNPTCRARFLTNGVVAQFVGQENSPLDTNDPTLRKTYFWMNLKQPVTDAWFGKYNQMCMRENDGTGLSQGQNMTYGTFSQRIYDFGKYIQRQPTNLTINCWFYSDFELDFITKWSNNMNSRALIWFYPAAVIMLILSIVIIILWKKSLLNKGSRSVQLNNENE